MHARWCHRPWRRWYNEFMITIALKTLELRCENVTENEGYGWQKPPRSRDDKVKGIRQRAFDEYCCTHTSLDKYCQHTLVIWRMLPWLSRCHVHGVVFPGKKTLYYYRTWAKDFRAPIDVFRDPQNLHWKQMALQKSKTVLGFWLLTQWYSH